MKNEKSSGREGERRERKEKRKKESSQTQKKNFFPLSRRRRTKSKAKEDSLSSRRTRKKARFPQFPSQWQCGYPRALPLAPRERQGEQKLRQEERKEKRLGNRRRRRRRRSLARRDKTRLNSYPFRRAAHLDSKRSFFFFFSIYDKTGTFFLAPGTAISLPSLFLDDLGGRLSRGRI